MTAPTVHVLFAGRPACRFTYHAPEAWPAGHLWVGIEDVRDATCTECLMLTAWRHSDEFSPTVKRVMGEFIEAIKKARHRGGPSQGGS